MRDVIAMVAVGVLLFALAQAGQLDAFFDHFQQMLQLGWEAVWQLVTP